MQWNCPFLPIYTFNERSTIASCLHQIFFCYACFVCHAVTCAGMLPLVMPVEDDFGGLRVLHVSCPLVLSFFMPAPLYPPLHPRAEGGQARGVEVP